MTVELFSEIVNWRFDDVEAMECSDCGRYGIYLRELLPRGHDTCRYCGAEYSISVYRESGPNG